MASLRDLEKTRKFTEQQANAIAKEILDGRPKSFDDYRHAVGQLAAYKAVLAEIDRQSKSRDHRGEGDEIE